MYIWFKKNFFTWMFLFSERLYGFQRECKCLCSDVTLWLQPSRKLLKGGEFRIKCRKLNTILAITNQRPCFQDYHPVLFIPLKALHIVFCRAEITHFFSNKGNYAYTDNMKPFMPVPHCYPLNNKRPVFGRVLPLST